MTWERARVPHLAKSTLLQRVDPPGLERAFLRVSTCHAHECAKIIVLETIRLIDVGHTL